MVYRPCSVDFSLAVQLTPSTVDRTPSRGNRVESRSICVSDRVRPCRRADGQAVPIALGCRSCACAVSRPRTLLAVRSSSLSPQLIGFPGAGEGEPTTCASRCRSSERYTRRTTNRTVRSDNGMRRGDGLRKQGDRTGPDRAWPVCMGRPRSRLCTSELDGRVIAVLKNRSSTDACSREWQEREFRRE